jgi:hypothetical protein
VALPDPLPEVTYTATVVDWITDGPPPGLVVCVCSSFDFPTGPGAATAPCNTPLSPCLMPPLQRTVDITLPPREDTFIAFEAAFFTNTVPIALYFNRHPTSDLVGRPPIRLVTLAVKQAIANAFGGSLDPTLGSALLRVFDCNGDPAANVRFTLESAPVSPAAIPFAYRNNGPTTLLTTTDDSGQFSFENVAPGFALVRAFLVNDTESLDDDTEVGSVTFPVRSAWTSAVDLRP